ncbi:hypothetical protein R8871_02567 [Paraburkholderia graminis C4D1M]|uniref:Uncharacterized protein n=1 Tax=Paraburkholderia graminis (strain ATCC 700544 / DSM 17151 / LMG 18924 / NCIMB 13744 / C4D1M) TaxID=396598 RepID=B1G968_PARG4|nr:VPA1262 family N-terminal domain-containing protein [Paraburkholderia graminis]EDT07329.1 hypothetical protein BgramDRAFT_5905 [Paraburkholderia graminis C4D1M]CAB3682052.1 hypothetical protein R8871_02567 [Paraburkholderia graminis C4D1M]
MPLAITIFSVSGEGLDPVFCYGFIRSVRGSGKYPSPNLPKGLASDCINRSDVPDTALTLLAWDSIVCGARENEVLDALRTGSLSLPEASPVVTEMQISGVPFGPLLVEENFQRGRVTGVGLLHRTGIASETHLKALADKLHDKLAGSMPRALDNIVSMIGNATGFCDVCGPRRPIGAVDYFYRSRAATYVDGPLFDVRPEQADFRSKAPSSQIHVRRHAAALDQRYRLQTTLYNYDEVLRSTILDIDAGVHETALSAPAHITEMTMRVFDETGELVDQSKVMFTQGMQFGFSVLGASDTLPPVFPGAPKSPDLEVRPRIHTLLFKGPSMGKRSGSLDILRTNSANLAALIGPISSKQEDIWFDRGSAGQVDVIRWIKKRIEQPGLVKAFLVDPYLGSDALKRVVARHGNQTAELFIVVSPGNIDPDADAAAAKSANDYLPKLASAATEWATKLAGKISVVHIKRGNGSRQAFHDRFLCVLDRDATPTVYLFSNSLSKAAGDWPFVICQLDQITSWRVYADILQMVEGRVDGLHPEYIWTTANVSATSPTEFLTPSAVTDNEAPWVVAANTLLSNIRTVIYRNSEFKPQVGSLIDKFLAVWREDIDDRRLADALFKVVTHRDAIVVFVSDHLRYRGCDEIASLLDGMFLDHILDALPDTPQSNGWWLPHDARRAVLGNLGRTIARKPKPTNFVRDRINPKVQRYVASIETQRFSDVAWDVHRAALFLSVIALEVASIANAPEAYRVGMASDYIHWLGRLMRSDLAANMYVTSGAQVPDIADDLPLAAQAILQVRSILGDQLIPPVKMVMDDPWVAAAFKTKLSPFC